MSVKGWRVHDVARVRGLLNTAKAMQADVDRIGLGRPTDDKIDQLRAALAAAEARAQAAETRAAEAKRERSKVWGAVDALQHDMGQMQRRRLAAEERADRLAAALAFYADPESWRKRIASKTSDHMTLGTIAETDSGMLARHALAADTPTQEVPHERPS